MKPFDVAEAFIELHGRRVPPPELSQAFEKSLQELGIRHFACVPHVAALNPRNAGLVLQSYAADWVRCFGASGRYRIDAVFRYADEKLVPFFWDDPDFRAVLTPPDVEILTAAAECGLGRGYTVPLHPPGGPPASCSVVADPGSIERGAHQAVFTMACFMYDAMLQGNVRSGCGATRAMQFSERERQCLELAAQGKDDWSIGSLLRISERTAHNHIERAKRRLGVCTRVQVIVHALNDGQISFGDVIKAATQREPPVRELRKKTN